VSGPLVFRDKKKLSIAVLPQTLPARFIQFQSGALLRKSTDNGAGKAVVKRQVLEMAGGVWRPMVGHQAKMARTT
jgi:hypothetical protein